MDGSRVYVCTGEVNIDNSFNLLLAFTEVALLSIGLTFVIEGFSQLTPETQEQLTAAADCMTQQNRTVILEAHADEITGVVGGYLRDQQDRAEQSAQERCGERSAQRARSLAAPCERKTVDDRRLRARGARDAHEHRGKSVGRVGDRQQADHHRQHQRRVAAVYERQQQ